MLKLRTVKLLPTALDHRYYGASVTEPFQTFSSLPPTNCLTETRDEAKLSFYTSHPHTLTICLTLLSHVSIIHQRGALCYSKRRRSLTPSELGLWRPLMTTRRRNSSAGEKNSATLPTRSARF